MRLGIRFKLIASFMFMVIFPIIMVLAAGINLGTRYQNAAQETQIHTYITLATISFVLPFVFCAVLFTWLISRSILIPLKELNTATENIMNGNLDFAIKYKKNDEMGRFSAAFDMMRVRLKESLEKQASYENSRKELIANISHDLRTPMSSIRGYVEGLQDGITHDKKKYDRYLAVIKDKTEKLDKLIDDLFHFSQLDLGHLVMDFKEHDSQEMLNAIVYPFEKEFIDNKIKLYVEKPFPSRTINADSNRIAQVFDNLINNSKKYVGENGEIEIEAVDEGNLIKIAIIDNGTGISTEDLPHIFDRFYRGEKSRSREFGGTGLGLAICKQIVEDHGGEIWVKSSLGVGTEVYFTLPVIQSI